MSETKSLGQLGQLLRQQELSLDQIAGRLIEDQRIRFEQDQHIPVEEYLALFPEIAAEKQIAVDLIYNEFLMERSSQETDRHPLGAVDIELWLKRFPKYASMLQRQLDVYSAMQGLDHELDDPVDRQDNLQRVLEGRRFQLKELIGSGTFAEVYRSRDEELKRDVAIKFARHSLIETAVELERFKREAKAAAKLTHPGIVAIHEIGQKGNRPYIVQEFVGGGTLKERIARGGYSHREAAEWILQIAEAIEYAHSFGIVHRDVKPANILFADQNRLKVADFGLAMLTDQESQLTQHGEVLGTPAYMSPEQAEGKQVEVGSDVYSIGVVLFELINGHLPFQGSASAVLNQVIYQEPVFSQKNVPLSLRSICLKAMSKRVQDRYTSAKELAMDLGRFLHGESVLARPMSVWEKSFRWMANRPAMVATLLGAFIVLLAIGSYSFFRIQDERQRFRQQRDIANERLLESLLNSAKTSLRSKQDGWFEATISDLAKVVGHPDANEKTKVLRELVAEALSDDSTRIRLDSEWLVARDRSLTSLEKSGEFLLAGLDDGTILGVGAQSGDTKFTLNGPKSKIEKIVCQSNGIWALAGSSVWEWKVAPGKNITEYLAEMESMLGRMIQPATNMEWVPDPACPALAIAKPDGQIVLLDVVNDVAPPRMLRFQAAQAPTTMVASQDGSTLLFGLKDYRAHWFDLKLDRIKKSFSEEDPIVAAVLNLNGGLAYWTTKVSYRTALVDNRGFRPSSTYRGAPICLDNFGENIIVGNEDGTVLVNGWNHQLLAKRKLNKGLTCLVADEESRNIWVGDDGGGIAKLCLVENGIKSEFFTTHGATTSGDYYWYDSKRVSLKTGNAEPVEFGMVTSLTLVANQIIAGNNFGELWIKRVGEASASVQTIKAHESSILCVDRVGEHWVSVDAQGNYRTCFAGSGKLSKSRNLGVGSVLNAASCEKYILANGENGTAILDEVGSRLLPGQFGDKATLGVCSRYFGIGVGAVLSVFAAESQEVIFQHEFDEDITCFTFSKDGSRLFCGFASGCQELSFSEESGKLTLQLKNRYECENLTWVKLDEVRHRLLTYSESLLSFFDVGTSRPCAKLNTRNPFQHRFAMTQQGDLLIGSKGVIKLAAELIEGRIDQRATRNECAELPLDFSFEIFGLPWAAEWSIDVRSDKEMIAFGRHYGKVGLVDPNRLKPIRIIDGFESEVWRVKFSPDSRFLATGCESGDGSSGLLTVFDVKDWSKKFEVEVGKRLVAGLSYHPTHKLIAVSSFDGGVWLVDADSGEVLQTLISSQEEGRRNSLATMDVQFSRDGNWLATVRKTGGIVIWKLVHPESQSEKGKAKVRKFKEISVPDQRLWALTFDQRSGRLVTASESGQIDFYQVGEFRHLMALKSGLSRLRSIHFSEDNRYLLVAAWSNPGAVWDLEKLAGEMERLLGEVQGIQSEVPVFPEVN